jgi:hypothetical protein
MKNYITVNRLNADSALEWAKTNCPHYITNDWHMTGYHQWDINLVDFFFADNDVGRKEMLMFALRWS